MEAATLKKKKNSISKLKIRKTIKNVVCRPDPVFWPSVTNEDSLQLETCLTHYRVDIPQFKKLHWKELKLIPKSERPKPPSIQRVNGLIFGISECRIAIQNKSCSAVMVESGVNPRVIIQPIVEICSKSRIPVLCLQGLRTLCGKNFGIRTICLGIKQDSLLDLANKILEIYQTNYSTVDQPNNVEQRTEPSLDVQDVDMVELKNDNLSIVNDNLPCPYLFRTDKKKRVFIPDASKSVVAEKKEFVGQNFIKLDGANKKPKSDRKAYMKMILKKISNNPNRVKIKQ